MESKKINQLATSVSPQTSDLTIIGDPVTGVSKKITLLQIANLFATTGTVTSVAVTETGDALTITGSPITSAGTINIGFAGDATQYVRGDGALADFPTSTGGGSSVSYYLNSSVSQGTIGGVAYRELSKDPISGAGTDITISANGYVASYITDANDPALLEVPGGNFNCEFYFSVNSNAHNPYVYAELYKYDGTTFTLLGSSQSVPEYLSNGTTLSPYYFAIPVATAALSVTDRLAIRIYVNVDGRVVTLHTENNHLCQVVTTFSKGLTSLNNLTRQVQFFGTGTSGTDFAITSSTATHTFNLPVASATNTGKLSSTDWSTFNNKQAALTFTAPLVNTSNTISIPAATTLVNGYLASADFTTFNNKQNAITLTTTGTSGAATLVGSTLNIPNYAPDLSNYVTLNTTQTITGTKVLQNGAVLPSTGGTNQLSVFINTFNIEEASGSTNRIGFNDSNNIYFNKGLVGGGGGINGGVISFNNSASRTYTLPDATGTFAFTSDLHNPVTIGTANGLSLSTQVLSLALASTSATGALSSTDWTTFNNKASTADLANYLPLTGGTLSGALNINLNSGTGLNVSTENVVFRASPTYGSPRQIMFTMGSGPTTTLEAKGYGANYITDFNILTYNSSGTAFNVFYGTSAGNVGIGTSSPFSLTNFTALSINGTTGGILDLKSNGTTGLLMFSNASATILSEQRNMYMSFETNATERMRITSGGNVGIGTTSPESYSGFNTLTIAGNTNGGVLAIRNPSGNGINISAVSSLASIDAVGASTPIVFVTNGSERMRITSGGDLYLGTSSLPSGATGTGAGTMFINNNLYIGNTSGTTGYAVRFDGYIDKLYVLWQNASGNDQGGVYLSYGATSWTANSDIRLKDVNGNIENAVDKLKTLNAINYSWKSDETKKQNLGLIAQEVEKVFPQVIDENKNGYFGVRYADLVPVLVKAIQELKAEIDELKNK